MSSSSHPESAPQPASGKGKAPIRARTRVGGRTAATRPKRNRLPMLLLAVTAVGAIVWVLVFGASGGTTPKEGATTTRGSDGRVVARRKPKLRLAGHVETNDGAPVGGATVFVLPKKRVGLNRDKADHEVTDAAGRWSLRTKKTVDCWIGVVAPGYRNTWLDGNTVDPGVQMFLVVEPAPPITVTLKDEQGEPLAGRSVQVLPWPDSGAFYFLPGPKGRQGEQWRVTNERGQAVFRRGDRGPVTITPQVEGYHSGKPYAWLPDTQGEVVFTMKPMATVSLRVADVKTGAPITGLATVQFFHPEDGYTFFSFTESLKPDGSLRLERSVPAGRFGVQVTVDGYAPWFERALEVGSAEQHALDVALQAARAPGTLTLALSGNKAALPPGARRRPPLSFLWRTDGDAALRGWQPGGPDWDAARRELSFALRPGTYDILLADVVSGRAALETGVVVGPGATRRIEIAMKPGQRGRLPPLRAKGDVARELVVKDERNRRLPVFGGTRGGRVRAAREPDVLRRGLAGEAIYLGPYPFDAFTLEVIRYGSGGNTRIRFE